MKKLFILFAIFTTVGTMAQSVGINADGSAANSSSMLDVSSTTKGFLPPRMTMEQMNAIPTPANGLIVYCSDCSPIGIHTYVSPSWSAMIKTLTGSSDISSLISDASEVVTEINIEAQIALGSSSTLFTDGALGIRDNNEKRLKYSNTVGATPNKINWYFYAPTTSVTVAQLKSIYYIASKTGVRAPYIFVYTKPTGTGDNATWYKSRFTYERPLSASELGFNQFYAIGKSNVEYGVKGLTLTKNYGGQDRVTGNELNEDILYIGIGTDSSSPSTGQYNFSLQEFGFENVSGKREVFKFTTK